jgi:hypothetical protein
MTQPYSLIRGAPLPTQVNSSTNVVLPATTDINTYLSFPTPVSVTIDFPFGDWRSLLLFSMHIDLTTNNAEVAFALDISGMTNVAAGSQPQDRLHVIAKSPISATFSLARVRTLLDGRTTFELKYAGSSCDVEDVSFEVIPLAMLGYQ